MGGVWGGGGDKGRLLVRTPCTDACQLYTHSHTKTNTITWEDCGVFVTGSRLEALTGAMELAGPQLNAA